MKLIIDVDNNLKEAPAAPNIVVLTNNTSLKGRRVFFIDKSCLDESDYTANAIDLLFKSLPSSFLPLKNTIYMRVFRPVFALIYQIEKLIFSKNIDQLLINNGGDYPFLTLYGGEGEGDYKWFNPSMLHNYFIYSYFKGKVEVKWQNKKKFSILNIIHIFREGYLSLKYVKRSFVYLLSPKSIDQQFKEDTNTYAIVNTKVSLINLINLLPKHILEKVLIVKPSTLKYEDKTRSTSYRITLKDYTQSFIKYLKIRKRVKSTTLYINLFEVEVELKSKILLRALRYEYIHFEAEFSAIERELLKHSFSNNTVIISNKTFGSGVTLIYSLSNRFNVPHYNFQSVAMSKMHYPILRLADVYFMYTYESYKFYSKLTSGYKYYLPIFNHNKRNVDTFKDKEQLTVSIFTQPDNYADFYLNFLKEIVNIYNEFKFDVNFIIKPHYRQNKLKEFKEIVESQDYFTIETPISRPSDLIKKSDFMMCMTSSVIFEAFQFNCPTIVLSISETDKRFIEINCMPEVNYVIKEMKDIIEILNNPLKSKHDYFIKREKYISNTQGEDYIKYLES